MSKDKTVTTAKQELVLAPENVVQLKLDDIHADYAWNVRSKAEVERESSDGVRDGKNEEGFGLHDFAKTFNLGGQDTPVTVAEVKGGKTLGGVKTSKKYELIAGFRRYTAISMLNSPEQVEKRKADPTLGPVKAVHNVADGHIKAVIRQFANATEARKLNARENTLRQNLTTPDLVRLVKELVGDPKEGFMTQTAASESLGITQGYVAKLSKIARLPDVILSHWRERTPIPGVEAKDSWKQLTNSDMLDLAGTVDTAPPAEVVARYVRMLNGEKEKGEGGDTKTAEQKINEKLDDLGYLLGALYAKGIIAKGTMAFGEVLGPTKAGYLLNAGAKDPNPEKREELVDVILTGWERGAKKFARKARKASEELQSEPDDMRE